VLQGIFIETLRLAMCGDTVTPVHPVP